jgi:hypothetical protein
MNNNNFYGVLLDPKSTWFEQPTQVQYFYPNDKYNRYGIAYQDMIFAAETGIVVSCSECGGIIALTWLDFTEAIRGDTGDLE